MTRHNNRIPHLTVKHDYFENSVFPLTIIEWNNFRLKYMNFLDFGAFQEETYIGF